MLGAWGAPGAVGAPTKQAVRVDGTPTASGPAGEHFSSVTFGGDTSMLAPRASLRLVADPPATMVQVGCGGMSIVTNGSDEYNILYATGLARQCANEKLFRRDFDLAPFSNHFETQSRAAS